MTSDSRCTVRVNLPSTIEVQVPESLLKDEQALKEFLWANHKDTLLDCMTLDCAPQLQRQNGATDTSTSTNSSAEDGNNSEAALRPATRPPVSPGSSSSLIADKHKRRRADLLDCIATVQRQFFQSERPNVVFGILLETLLELTESEYGFIGEIKYEKDTGVMYLQTHAITNIAWNQTTKKFYEDSKHDGLKFYNLNSLFGTVMTTREPLIANDPSTHPKRAGIPKGHPPLNHFLGIPFFKNGGEMNGMVGISNKPGGYHESDIDFLEPFTVTCSNLIQAYRQIEYNRYLIDNLEASVKARTHELELANLDLEEANRRVQQTARMQLEHFGA